MIVYLAWLIMIITFIYTIILAGSYWLNGKKTGAIVTFILSIAILILPFYSLLMI